MATKPTPPSKRTPPKRPPSPKATPPTPKRTMPAKNFTVGTWDADDAGEKIMIYADSGMGKTTLSSTAPTPVFIGLDDGGRKLANPITGERLHCIHGVSTFADTLMVLQDHSLFKDYETVAVDTVTLLQDLAPAYMFETIHGEKGRICRTIEDYGYGKGYRHLYDTMTSILPLVEALANIGKNVILIAQAANIKVANAESEDFIKEGPRLYTGTDKTPSVAAAYMELMDHVLRIGLPGRIVEDKKASGSTTRAIFTKAEPWFFAKSRWLSEPLISFETPEDDSLWRFMFPEKY